MHVGRRHLLLNKVVNLLDDRAPTFSLMVATMYTQWKDSTTNAPQPIVWLRLKWSWYSAAAASGASVTPLCKLRLNNNKTSQFGFLLSVFTKRSACPDHPETVMGSKNPLILILPSQPWHFLIALKKCYLCLKSINLLWIIFHIIEKIHNDGKTVWGII